MKQKMNNEVILQGYLFDHDLVKGKVQNKESKNFGKDFIRGTISIATDAEGLNVVQVTYRYTPAVTSTGAPSGTYQTLENIINNNSTWAKSGKEGAMKVRAVSAIALNDYYPEGSEEIVSTQRAEGGFLNAVNVPEEELFENKFNVDMLITGISDIVDEDEHLMGISLRGATFNFKKAILPISVSVKDEQGIEYFRSLDPSPTEPVFTNVFGSIINTTVVHTETQESKWGQAYVNTTRKTFREYLAKGSSPCVYDFGDENVLTIEEVETAITDRNVYLAEKKASDIAYRESRKRTKSTGPESSAPSVSEEMKIKREQFKGF